MSAVAGKPGQKYSISASAVRYLWAESLAGTKRHDCIFLDDLVSGGSYYKTTGWHM